MKGITIMPHKPLNTKLPSRSAETEYFSDGNYKITHYYSNEIISRIVYFNRDDVKHRCGDLPSVISWELNGDLSYEVYFFEGNEHRCGLKPSYIEFVTRSDINRNSRYDYYNTDSIKLGEICYMGYKEYGEELTESDIKNRKRQKILKLLNNGSN